MAGILEPLEPLLALVKSAADPEAVSTALLAAAGNHDTEAMVRVLGHGDLASAALRYAGVLDASGSLAPDARDRLLRLDTVVGLYNEDVDKWSVVMTVPDYLRAVLPHGELSETLRTLHDMIAAARRRIVIASPFLDPGFERLIPGLSSFLSRDGNVLLITRELARPDSHNAAMVRSLREHCAHSAQLQVVSWEEEGLGLHLKALVADGTSAYVGSANFTWGGLSAHAELGVRLHGPSVRRIECLLDLLAEELRRRRRLQSR